jgi:hypothetical protein
MLPAARIQGAQSGRDCPPAKGLSVNGVGLDNCVYANVPQSIDCGSHARNAGRPKSETLAARCGAVPRKRLEHFRAPRALWLLRWPDTIRWRPSLPTTRDGSGQE